MTSFAPASRLPLAARAVAPGPLDAQRVDDSLDLPEIPEVMEQRRFGVPQAVWILAATALALRLAAILMVGDSSTAAAGEFGSLAAGLLAGAGFSFNETGIYTQHGLYEPSSAQPPLYPVILAGFYWLLGTKTAAAHFAALGLNAVLGAAMVVTLWATVRRVGGTAGVATAAAALLAFWPTQIFAATVVHPVTLITLLVLATVYCWARAVEGTGLGAWVAFGFSSAAAALAWPVLLPALLIACVMAVLARVGPWPVRLRSAALIAVCTLVVIGPWSYRNWRVHDAFMPVTGTFWAGVWKGNNPASTGGDHLALTPEQRERYWSQGHDRLRQQDLLSDQQRQALDGQRSAAREGLWRQWSLEFISEHPGRYAQLCAIRLAKTAWAEWDDPRSRDPLYIYFGSRSLLLIGTLAGLVLALGRGWRLDWPLAVVAWVLVACTFTVTSARSALPLEPLQLALAALALVVAWQARFGPRERPPIVRRFMGYANDGTVVEERAGVAGASR